MGKKLAMREF
jgi:2C-methyl-D-erythritol 2,4-cyclodiphosphate synthase